MAAPPPPGQTAVTFSAAFTVATAASVIPTLLTRGNRPRLQAALSKALSSAKSNGKLALLPAVLPVIFRWTDRFVEKHGDRLSRFDRVSLLRILKDGIPALVSSPLFLLLPANYRLHVVLYAISTLLYSFTRPLRPKVQLECEREDPPLKSSTVVNLAKNWRAYLPPIWTLSSASHAWLIWAFLYEHNSFPPGYSRVILDHSRRYVPDDRKVPDLLRILGNTHHPRSISSSPHSFMMCEVLHPGQVSCTANYVAACKDETKRALPWVAGFSALSMVMSGKLGEITQRPFGLVADLVESTTRGTVYISGTITTAWGFACLLQRLLPAEVLPQGRWLINGSVPSILILLLSRSRQVAIAMYQFRIALQTGWNVWKAKGGRSIRFGDIWIIALCWVGLMRIRRTTDGGRIKGIVGQAMRLIDGTESLQPRDKRDDADDVI